MDSHSESWRSQRKTTVAPADLKRLMPGYNSYGVRMCSTRLLALSR